MDFNTYQTFYAFQYLYLYLEPLLLKLEVLSNGSTFAYKLANMGFHCLATCNRHLLRFRQVLVRASHFIKYTNVEADNQVCLLKPLANPLEGLILPKRKQVQGLEGIRLV